LEDWNRDRRVARGVRGELIGSTHSRNSRNPLRELTGEPVRHCASVANSGDVNSSGVEIHSGGDIVEQGFGKRDIISILITSIPAHAPETIASASSVPGSGIQKSIGTVWRNHGQAVFRSNGVEAFRIVDIAPRARGAQCCRFVSTTTVEHNN
jgi:hypothetical protein